MTRRVGGAGRTAAAAAVGIRGGIRCRRRPAIPPHMPVAFIPRALEPDRAGTGEVLQVAHAADLVDRIVAPLIQQFGMLQQQMVDEMNQSRALMFDTFASMHQEQSSFLNRELEQLRQLSQELQTLRADLERQTRLFLEARPQRCRRSPTADRTTSPPSRARARVWKRTASVRPSLARLRKPARKPPTEFTPSSATGSRSFSKSNKPDGRKSSRVLPGAVQAKTPL